MTTKTATKENSETLNAKLQAPSVLELDGYITVFQAAMILEKKQSAVNYYLNHGDLQCIYFGRVTADSGEKSPGVVLLKREAVETFKPVMIAREQEQKRISNERAAIDEENKRIIQQAKEAKAKLAERKKALNGKH